VHLESLKRRLSVESCKPHKSNIIDSVTQIEEIKQLKHLVDKLIDKNLILEDQANLARQNEIVDEIFLKPGLLGNGTQGKFSLRFLTNLLH
jgi:hypothetical protein